MNKTILTYATLSFALLAPFSANSAIVHLSGDTVDFYYDAADSGFAYYGNLQVVGDTIFALPNNFFAQSTDGIGSQTGTPTDILNVTGSIQVIAKDGYALDSVTVSEGGSYRATGTGTVDVDSTLNVFDWYNPLPIVGTFDSVTMSVLGDLGDYTIADGQNHDWSALGEMNLTTAMWDDINHIGLSLTNRLSAFSENIGDSAIVDKTITGGGIGVSIATTVVPIPAAAWLFGSGLLALVGFSRSRK